MAGAGVAYPVLADSHVYVLPNDAAMYRTIRALRRAARDGVRVIGTSVGWTRKRRYAAGRILERVVRRLNDDDRIIVASAGNDFDGTDTVSDLITLRVVADGVPRDRRQRVEASPRSRRGR